MAKSPRTRTCKIAPPAGYKYKSIDSFCRRTATASQAITPTTHDQEVSQPLDKECSFDNRVTRAERRLMEESKSKHWLKCVVEKLWRHSIKTTPLRDLNRKCKLGELFFELKKQWVFNLDTDFVDSHESCRLCGHKHVNKHFHIENKYNGIIIKAGSECIKQFRIENLSKVDSLDYIKDLINTMNASCLVSYCWCSSPLL